MPKTLLLVAAFAVGIVAVLAVVIAVPRMARSPRPAMIATSSPTPRRLPQTLAEVRTVFVEPTTNNEHGPIHDPGLKHILVKNDLLTVVDSKDEADAIFHLVEKIERSDNTRVYKTGPIARVWTRDTKAEVEATLRQAESGAILWSSKKTKTVSGSPYYGELSGELIDELRLELSRARGESTLSTK